MAVRTIWATPNAESLVLYMARVSNPANQDNTNTRLINYLIEHRHWSPFELVNFCVEIKTSRAVSAQILRHRSFSFQEFSQRYSEVQDVEPILLRRQAEKNRQSSAESINPTLWADDLLGGEKALDVITEYIEDGVELYKELVSAGVAKECARMILPMASSTTLYMNGSLRSWVHYLNLRCAEDVQLEHREVANEIKGLFILYFPIISEALGWS